MTELKTEHILMLAIVAFVLYHFMGRCSCGNGFRVSNQWYDPMRPDGPVEQGMAEFGLDSGLVERGANLIRYADKNDPLHIFAQPPNRHH